jgi:hypothetical protein
MARPHHTANARDFASLETAAARYDVNTRTLRNRIADGTITGYRIGRLIKVDLNECDERLVRVIPTRQRAAS